MNIHGREINFFKTVGAICDIEEKCPDQNIKNIQKLLEGNFKKRWDGMATIIVALNKGYEDAQKFDDPNYEGKPLTYEELKVISEEDFMALFTEATRVFYQLDQTVETEPSKKKEEESD